MSGKVSEFLTAHGEWLRWLICVGAIGVLYLSDTRYAKKEELAIAMNNFAAQSEGQSQRLIGMEKTLAIMALNTETLQDHEARLRALEKVRR